MQDAERLQQGVTRKAEDEAVRELALRVARRRMFSDLSETDRAALVEAVLEAHAVAWGPLGRPDDVEARLATAMFHAMMATSRERRMLEPPARVVQATSLDGLLEEWLTTEPARAENDQPSVDEDLTDRFLRQLSPADAWLLWLRCEGYTREQVADLLGIRANAVSIRLHRLRTRLRESLDPVVEAPSAERRDSGPNSAGSFGREEPA